MATTEKTRDMVPADEVERIIAERVEAASARMTAEVAEQLAAFKDNFTPGAASALADQGAMEALAMAIAGVTDQEFGRRRIPPEDMAKRVRAREKMEELIQRTFTGGVQPTYDLTQVLYVGEQIIRPLYLDRTTKTTQTTSIGWWDVPNEFMIPTNDEAKAIHALFRESIGGGANKRKPSLRMTPGGLTVRSGGMDPTGGRDQAPRAGRDMHEPAIKGRNGERAEIVTRVLGTLMPPARQVV